MARAARRAADVEWIENFRGSGRLARRRRLALGLAAPGVIGIGMVICLDTPHLAVGVTVMAAGWFLLGSAVALRPIPAVTWRAKLAALVHGRSARRAAVNASGHRSARARRSATNRAAWAAQRARDGRAARSVDRLSPYEDEVAAWRERRRKRSLGEDTRRYFTG